MPSEKRQRQDEGRLMRLESQRSATQKDQRKRQARTLAFIVGAIIVVAGLIALFSADDADDETSTTETTETTESNVVLPGAGASITGETPCPPADGSAERTTSFEQAPPMCIDAAKSYTATLETTEGDIVIELDDAAAPQTVNNFVVLARYHFYDNVPFHRIIPGFMDQAGDPVGPQPGTGGPGYTIPDELPTADEPYPTGTIAMANTGQPGSGGSQWFITVEGGGDQLAPTYAAFGRVVEGQDVVDEINQHGDAATNGQPTKVITITTITIAES
jgi:cyclophilin family peptidyl-prolyl cis-trans isomerase